MKFLILVSLVAAMNCQPSNDQMICIFNAVRIDQLDDFTSLCTTGLVSLHCDDGRRIILHNPIPPSLQGFCSSGCIRQFSEILRTCGYLCKFLLPDTSLLDGWDQGRIQGGLGELKPPYKLMRCVTYILAKTLALT
jgi:hypothetical protein